MQVKDYATKILSLVKEAKQYKSNKDKLLNDLKIVDSQLSSGKIDQKGYDNIVSKYLKGKKKEEVIQEYNSKILAALDQIKVNNDSISNALGHKKIKGVKVKKDINVETIKSIKGKKGKKKEIDIEYTVYQTNQLGKVANYFMEGFTKELIKKSPGFFKNLFFSLKSSGIRVLSKTYVSVMLFLSVVAFLLSIAVLLFVLQGNLFFNIIRSFFLSIFFAIAVFALIYIYPATLVNGQRRKMKNELPFVVIHMAAIAGSGAHPISMFKLILSSKEYPAMQTEIKKIVNYVNLFGYDLVGALKSVAVTTPLKDFNELLNGMATTIETGGSLKSYLEAKSKDLMGSYRLDRKKYLESLGTYSDVYTGILIAAPLLFFVALAIIQMLGGNIGGITVSTLAIIGTYVVIPLLNVGFMIFLNITQPG